MKKLLITLSLILPMLAVADQYDRRLIHTNGYGEVKVKPDMAKLSLSVQVTRKAALDAKTEVDKRVNELLDALKKQGIKEKDVIASGLRTNPQYEYSKSLGRNLTGYNATRTLNVTVRKLEKLTNVMDLALKNDIQNISHISYESSEKDKHINQARKNAIANSKLKAKALAEAYNAELGAIVSIQYHSRQANFALEAHTASRPRMAQAMALSAAPSQPATYLPDEITFSDNIQVTFDLIVNN